MGEKEGTAAFNRFVDYTAATSPRSTVASNIRRGSHFYGLDRRGEQVTGLTKNDLPPGYGHIAQNTHQKAVDDVYNTGSLGSLSRPKISSFAENLKGNQAPMTIDTHNFSAVRDDPKVKISPSKGQYRYLEQYQSEIAEKMGMTPAQFQASVWIAGDTGVADARPFVEVFDDVLTRTAQKNKTTRKKALEDFIEGKAPLFGLGALMASGSLITPQEAEAGVVSGLSKQALEGIAKKSGDTQVATTGGSYQKAGDMLREQGVTGDVLDYGAGRGHGTQYLPGNTSSYEPNPKPGYSPTYTSSPDETYDGIANLNVLNVVPEPLRQEIAQDIIGKLNKDGVAAVGARSYSDVMNAKNPQVLDDGGIITQKGTYQYGFGGKNEGLVDYLLKQAGAFPDKEFEVTPAKLAATGALIKRTKGLMGPAAGTALVAGSALSPEEANAGIMTPGMTAAREAVGFQRGSNSKRQIKMKGNMTPEVMTNKMRNQIRNPQGRTPNGIIQDIIHSDTNYNEWGERMRIADGEKSGKKYKAQFDAFVEDLMEVAPDLREELTQYGVRRLFRTPEEAARMVKKHKEDGKITTEMLMTIAAGMGLGSAGMATQLESAQKVRDTGTIRAPNSGFLHDITIGARDLERRLEGSPAQLFFPSGLVDYLEQANREERPNNATRAWAFLDFI